MAKQKKTIKVKNLKNGVFSYFTEKQWEATKKNPLFAGVFVEQTPATPPEVAKLEQRKKEQAEAKKPIEQKTASSSEKKDEGK